METVDFEAEAQGGAITHVVLVELPTSWGPLQVSLAEPQSVWQKAWIKGLESFGFPRTNPLSDHLGGPNIAPETIDPKTKQRSYAANAYLDPIRNRPNLTVRTGFTVTKVIIEKSQPARKEVILSAIAINSHRILELSEIGGADLLQRLGIDVMVDNPHVGENLQNHSFTGLIFEACDDIDTLDAYFRQKPEAVAAVMQDYATKGIGPLSTSNMITMAQLPLPELYAEDGRKMIDQLLKASDTCRSPATTAAFASVHEAFVRSILTTPTKALGNYVFGSGYAPFDGPSPDYRAPGKHISVAIELSHPLPRGSVHIDSAAPQKAGTNEGVRIDCGYLAHPLDLELLARQVRFVEDAFTRAEPLAKHLKPITKRFGDLDAAKDYVRRTLDGAYHHAGTCAMMPRATGGVVDSRLRIYRCANFRVCDASIMPLEPTANPQAVVCGAAELAADFIKESLV